METVTDREQNQCMYYKPTVIPKKFFLKFICTCGCNQDKTVTIMQRHIQWMSIFKYTCICNPHKTVTNHRQNPVFEHVK